MDVKHHVYLVTAWRRPEGQAGKVRYVGCMIDKNAEDTNPKHYNRRANFKKQVKTYAPTTVQNCIYACFADWQRYAALQVIIGQAGLLADGGGNGGE